MEQKCGKCGHEWEYKGDSKYYATCPHCLNKVRVKNEAKTT